MPAAEGEAALADLGRELGPAATWIPASRFDPGAGARALTALYGVATLDGFGAFEPCEIAAAGAIAAYVELTQKGRAPAFRPLARTAASSAMAIDPATRRNLELTETLAGERRGSLLDAIDLTVTAAGARALAARIAAPLTDPAAVAARLDAVEALVAERALRAEIRDRLKRAPDAARALSRLALGRGSPRDLGGLRDAIATAEALARRLAPVEGGAELSRIVEGLRAGGTERAAYGQTLARLLADPLPPAARDGGFVAAGADAALDDARTLRDDAKRVIAGLEARLKDETGIASLKIRHNGVLGYYVEATSIHADKLLSPPLAERFIHRQTLPNAARFTTPELARLAGEIVEAGGRALAIELSHFEALAAEAARLAGPLSEMAAAIADLDVAGSLAELAATRDWARPRVADGLAFRIEKGRHPVVEAALARQGQAFTPNDLDLSERRLWLVTGPNMAGKSTFLRQAALIAILAQAGSFVPAAAADIGIVDRLFSRVGAADDLARGRSTFMVEMVETAAILNAATDRSLVILDEIGRGTATFDGLSIAWAATEHLHEVNRARGLFATHYHELTRLTAKLDALAAVTMRVKEWKGEIVFLHEVAPGSADRSYGVAVAKLAGLPAAVVRRAEQVLRALEKGDEGRRAATLIDDLPLFSAAASRADAAEAERLKPVAQALAALDPDTMSPKEALEALYRLKRLAGG